MTPSEAIRAATLEPARWLANGAEPDSGTVAVGKRADLILVEGDPSTDVAALENIRGVGAWKRPGNAGRLGLEDSDDSMKFR